MKSFTFEKEKFLLNGEEFTVISGAIHYFRTVPESWEDRLKKLKACGFNTVETYTSWNLHERREGEFDFSGILDIERFIETAEKTGLYVIIRPGPYICAEWDLGGLPSWLLSYPDIALRCNDPLYLSKVEPYYKELFSRIRPHLCTNGGNVIMVQVENEYGSYGNDKEYLRYIVDLYRQNGINCLLFTSDGACDFMLGGGTLPEILAVANFGSGVKDQLLYLKEFQGERPLMCGEFWCGWFDHWYEEHTFQRSPEDILSNLDEFFEIGASFNFYMFHGGTNFGFCNGANHTGTLYQPTVTSYDYAAPLTEAGDLTPLYFAMREHIHRKTGRELPELDVKNSDKKAYGEVKLTKKADLFDNIEKLSRPIKSAFPKTMEQLGQDFGYILYKTTLRDPFTDLPLIAKIHDRALFFLNGKRIGIRERSRRNDEIILSLGRNETAELMILVENMGRVNYGTKLMDRKGILDGVRLGQQFHYGWEMYPLTMDDLSELSFEDIYDESFVNCENTNAPTFYRGEFTINDDVCDTFIRPEGFTKGFCVINGFNLGRFYNPAGPQRSLYVPASVLVKGKNTVTVFESDGINGREASVFFDEEQILG